jgi:pilus assembly protein CpaF
MLSQKQFSTILAEHKNRQLECRILFNMNPLELLADDQVTDVLINSTNSIFIERAGLLERTNFAFNCEAELKVFAKDLMQQANSRVDLAKPFGEGKILSSYGELRVHCLLGGECSNGTQVSIRRHPLEHLSLDDLVSNGSLEAEQQSFLLEVLRQKKNFVIIGPAGSGKTTLLSALLSEIKDERIVCIEDNPELNLKDQVSLFSRRANSEGFGEITITDLFREALRMRPDRIVVGEARGSEIEVLLQAMNTGHSGVGFTVHANGFAELVPRLLAMLSSCGIQPSLGRMMIASSIDYVIEVSKLPNRKVLRIEKLAI